MATLAKTLRYLAMCTFAALVLVACDGDGADDDAGGSATTTTTSAPDEGGDDDGDDDGEVSGESATIATAESDLGVILVDDSGNTLYVFLQDEENVSNCSGGCADNWPPVLASDVAAEGEVDGSLLGTTTSREGSQSQATYAGRPLYRFAADSAPGDTNGQGVGDVWFVVGVDGEPIR